jgi:predicted AlkP superfamily phosphohydrolase/phosphomutase
MSKRLAGVLAIGLATVSGSTSASCRRAPVPPQRLAERVILLGFDGAAPNFIEPLVAQGKLPNLKRLMEIGSYGHLQSFSPAKSAILWTSIATGKTMLKHGIIDWTYVNKKGIQVPYEDRARRVKTYWEILDDRSVTTGTINWWMSYPPAPIAHGYIVSNAFRHRPEPPTVHPAALFQPLDPLRMNFDEAKREMQKRGIPDWQSVPATIPVGGSDEVLESYGLYVAQDATVDRVSDYLLQNRPVEVFSTYFRLVDVTSHFAVRYVDRALYDETVALEKAGKLTPEAEAKLDRDFARVMTPIYELMDRIVGKYLERLDGHTTLVICSDHGFRYFRGRYAHAHLTMEPPDGIVFLAGPGVRKGARITNAKLFDIAPTILHAIGQPVATDMDGSVLVSALDDAALQAHPLRTIASFESGARATGSGKENPQLNEDVLEDLKALGYIQNTPASPKPSPDAKR